jgi:nucleotide-binding universal stress UspA family protein
VPDPVLVGVALDGHDAAPVGLGKTLARLTTRRLALLHAYPYEPLALPAQEYEETLRTEATEGLERIAASLREELDVTVLTAPRVSVARALQEAAEAMNAVALVVGSSRRGRLGLVLPGSVGERLLGGAPCPVGITPNDGEPVDEGFEPIGVAFDDRAESREALEVAIELARAAGAKLTTYTVFEPVDTAPALVTPGWVVPEVYVDDRHAQAEAGVRAARDRVPDDLLAGAELLMGDPADLLGEVTAELDLMVCGSRGYGPLRAVLLGSVSGRLARTAECPLLITPRGHGGKLVASR